MLLSQLINSSINYRIFQLSVSCMSFRLFHLLVLILQLIEVVRIL